MVPTADRTSTGRFKPGHHEPGPGRPYGLTAALEATVLAVLRAGGSGRDAARAAGVTPTTIVNWAATSATLRQALTALDARRLAGRYGVDAGDLERMLGGEQPRWGRSMPGGNGVG